MMTDPVADMLTRIRNANLALHDEVAMPSSKLREEIAKVLAAEGYIAGYEVAEGRPAPRLRVRLRYDPDRNRVIRGIRRISRPGRRVYRGVDDLPRSLGGLGVVVISTSQGLLPDREARRRRLGGELICEVW